jgi:hypothetical protein
MSAQDAPPFTLKDYSYRRAADDIAELARQLGLSSIILGGHDWRGSHTILEDGISTDFIIGEEQLSIVQRFTIPCW